MENHDLSVIFRLSFGNAIIIVFLEYATNMVGYILINIVFYHRQSKVPESLLFILELCSCWITLLIIRCWSKQSWIDLIAPRRVNKIIWCPTLVSIAGIYFLAGFVATYALYFLPMPAWVADAFREPGWLAAIFGAPLVEEIIFRSVILGGFLCQYSQNKAILLSPCLFTFVHLNPWQLFPAFFFGIFAGWVFSETRSIWPVLVMHIIHNGACHAEGYFAIYPFGSGHKPPPCWTLVLGMVLLSTGARFLNPQNRVPFRKG